MQDRWEAGSRAGTAKLEKWARGKTRTGKDLENRQEQVTDNRETGSGRGQEEKLAESLTWSSPSLFSRQNNYFILSLFSLLCPRCLYSWFWVCVCNVRQFYSVEAGEYMLLWLSVYYLNVN